MNPKKILIREIEWLKIVSELDALFPKGKSIDRGKAMVLLARTMIILNVHHE